MSAGVPAGAGRRHRPADRPRAPVVFNKKMFVFQDGKNGEWFHVSVSGQRSSVSLAVGTPIPLAAKKQNTKTKKKKKQAVGQSAFSLKKPHFGPAVVRIGGLGAG